MAWLRLSFTPASGNRLLDRQLEAFKGDVRARQKHARTLGGFVRRDTKKNIRAQQSFDGRPFTPRKVKRRRTAMLRGLGRNVAVISKAQEGGGVIVSWRNPFEAGIAGRHQWGIGEDWSPRRMAAARGTPDYRAPCTAKQAKALRREGFRLPRKGKPPKRLSARDIQERFSLGQAGVILRIMRTGSAKGKQRWQDTVPVRAFLGVTPQKAEEYSRELAERILRQSQKGT